MREEDASRGYEWVKVLEAGSCRCDEVDVEERDCNWLGEGGHCIVEPSFDEIAYFDCAEPGDVLLYLIKRTLPTSFGVINLAVILEFFVWGYSFEGVKYDEPSVDLPGGDTDFCSAASLVTACFDDTSFECGRQCQYRSEDLGNLLLSVSAQDAFGDFNELPDIQDPLKR